MMTANALKEATDLRTQLMRQGVQDVRRLAAEASSVAAGILSAGNPENGLRDALESARRKLDEAEGILGRIEEEHFHGHKEG